LGAEALFLLQKLGQGVLWLFNQDQLVECLVVEVVELHDATLERKRLDTFLVVVRLDFLNDFNDFGFYIFTLLSRRSIRVIKSIWI